MGVTIKSVYFSGASPWKGLLLGALAHGLFEFIAIFTALSIGVSLSYAVTMEVGKLPGPDIKDLIMKSLKLFLVVIIPMLAIAAYIEAHITPILWH